MIITKKVEDTTPQIFNFNKHEVRTVIQDNGEVWFVANDRRIKHRYESGF